MNLKRIQQQLNMIFNILAFVFDPIYQALLDSLPPYKETCEALQTMAENLRAKMAIYRKLLESLAEAKKLARITLAEAAFPIMSVARSYCIRNGLTNEASQLKCTLSELRHMSFPVLISKMAIVIPIVEELLSDLAPYNVTLPLVNQWKDKFQNMKNLMSGSHNAKEQRKAIGDIIMQDTETMLKFFNEQPCTLVASFISIDPEYYISFQNIKRIGKGNIHYTRLLAHCQSELGEPYFGLTVTVDEFTDPATGNMYKADSAVTNASGDCEVSGFFAGNRTVTVSGKNIVTTTFPAVSFIRGKATAKSYTLQPSFANLPSPQQEKQKTEN